VRLLLPVVLLAAVGCGPREPKPVPVRGTVTLDGKPLPEGQIAFITPGNPPELLDVRGGAFDGLAMPGDRRVEVAAYRPVRITPDIPKHLHALMADGKENYLPDRYHRQSTLSAEVRDPGPNEFTFELNTK
jgi:hypothetical protein